MKIKFLNIFIICTVLVNAQDVHWSQFYDNPLYLSPTNAGNFDGTHRFVSSYKDQWRSVSKTFQTFTFTYDKKLKNEDFRIGGVFLSDQVGDGKFKTYELLFNSAYLLPINKEKTQNFLFGLQCGWNHRSFDFTKFYFDEQYNGVSFDQNIQNTENLSQDSKNNLTISAGLHYQYLTKKTNLFEISYSAFNLNQANNSFYESKVKRDIRNTFFIQYLWKYDKNIYLIPSIIFQKQGKFQEFVFGGNLQYNLNKKRTTQTINFAAFFRLKDAFILKFGLKYNSWYAGLSYDVNISKLQVASNKRGGFEINLRYIIHKFKTENKYFLQCPDFI